MILILMKSSRMFIRYQPVLPDTHYPQLQRIASLVMTMMMILMDYDDGDDDDDAGGGDDDDDDDDPEAEKDEICT